MSFNLTEIHSLAQQLQEESFELAKESSRVVSGFHHLDPEGMREIMKSCYHLNWNLKDLDSVLGEITKKQLNKDFISTIDDIRYDDIDDITEAVLRTRAIAFFKRMQLLFTSLQKLAEIFKSFGISKPMLNFIVGRSFLELHFLKDEMTAVTGEELSS